MDVLLTGSVAYDYLMTFPGYFQEHILPEQSHQISLSFLVDSLVRRRGGIAPNIAYTMVLLGENPKVLATVGEDFEEYRLLLENKGVDTSLIKVIEGTYTASFFVTTDKANAQIASFYPGAMSHAGELSLHQLEGALPDLVVVSPNDPAAMGRYIDESKELGVEYVYDPSQQVVRVNGDVLRQGIEGATALFANEYECGLVQNKTGMNKDEILEQVKFMVVTRGEKGSVIYAGGEQYEVAAVPPLRVIDPTGGGDAYRGGFLTGYKRGWDWLTCGQMGALAATYCLENDGPQGQEYTLSEFIERYRQHFDDHNLLDNLLKN